MDKRDGTGRTGRLFGNWELGMWKVERMGGYMDGLIPTLSLCLVNWEAGNGLLGWEDRNSELQATEWSGGESRKSGGDSRMDGWTDCISSI